jgi:hypothetical protein
MDYELMNVLSRIYINLFGSISEKYYNKSDVAGAYDVIAKTFDAKKIINELNAQMEYPIRGGDLIWIFGEIVKKIANVGNKNELVTVVYNRPINLLFTQKTL